MQPIEILKEDFDQTLKFIDKCDTHMFTVKNWAIVTSSAVIAFSISQERGILALLNIGILLPFLYWELIYKSFQDSAIEHTDDLSDRIDKYLENPTAKELLAGYEHGFGRKLQHPCICRVFSVLCNRQRLHILNFYGLLALISVVAFYVG